MNMKRFLFREKQVLLTALFLTLGLLSGCGIAGETTRFVLPLDSVRSMEVTSEIRIASVVMEKHAARLTTVGTQRWGKFDSEDLINIEQSLCNTLASIPIAVLSQSKSRIDVHLIIRRYFVATSNTCGAVLACVAWAATDSKGKIIYHEQFYASKTVYFIGTIGLLKDSIHKAIVLRIATISLYLASGRGDTDDQEKIFKDTYNSFDEAASHLPQIMVSEIMAPGISVSGIPNTQTVTSVVFWNEADTSEEFNWKEYLREFYKNHNPL